MQPKNLGFNQCLENYLVCTCLYLFDKKSNFYTSQNFNNIQSMYFKYNSLDLSISRHIF